RDHESTGPADRVERERVDERRSDADPPHRAVDDAELERAERDREPARLVRERAVVPEIEDRPHGEHQRHQLDRPPPVNRDRDEQRRQDPDDSRLDAASQRVRHVRRRKARAAYLAPAIVSAAGNAHWPATPASASVRRSSVRAGTVESGASTIHSSCVSRSCASTRSASSGSFRNPRKNPVAQITWVSRPDRCAGLATRKRPASIADSTGSSHSRPGGYDGAERSRSTPARRTGAVRWNPARPRFEKNGRGALSGRRSGGRRRIDVTSAPAASAFRHSVAAAIPAPTTTIRAPYSCGSYAWTASGYSAGRARPGWPVAIRTCGTASSPSSSKPPSTARTRSTRRCRKLVSHPERTRTFSACARNSATDGW